MEYTISKMAKPKLLICGFVTQRLVEKLEDITEIKLWRGSTEIDPSELRNTDILIIRSPFKIPLCCAEKPGNLKVVIRAGSGVDGLFVEKLQENNVSVYRVGYASDSVAEHAFALLLASAREIPKFNYEIKRGRWLKHEALGIEIHGKTILIIGYGQIGQKIAKIAEGFGMIVQISDPTLHKEDKIKALKGLKNAKGLNLTDGLKSSDFIIVCACLNAHTKWMIGVEQFAIMRPNAILINVARSEILEPSALEAAIRNGQIKGVGLDVHYTEPDLDTSFLSHHNVVATPHIGAQTTESRDRIESKVLEIICKYII